jgi:hypothetical protein
MTHDNITVLDAGCELDRDLFRIAVVAGATNPAGCYICDLHYDPEAEREFIRLAHLRTLDNNSRKKNRAAHLDSAAIAGGGTADTMGMLGEGPVRMALAEEDWSEAFVEGDTDDRPDVILDSIRLDVKTASRNGRSTFSVEAHKYDGDKFDALLLVKPLRAGAVRVYACAAKPNLWPRMKGVWTPKGRLPDYYLLTMPDPAPTKARRFSGHVEELKAKIHTADYLQH